MDLSTLSSNLLSHQHNPLQTLRNFSDGSFFLAVLWATSSQWALSKMSIESVIPRNKKTRICTEQRGTEETGIDQTEETKQKNEASGNGENKKLIAT